MNKGGRGFSLVELLIAMSLLLMVTSLGTYGYGLYSRYWNENVGNFEAVIKEVKGVSTMFRVLEQLKPYILLNDKNLPYHYFEGGKSIIRSVTSKSMTDPNHPAVFELKVSEVNGHQILTYSERAITGAPPIREQDVLTYDTEITLLEGFNDLSFEFYGLESFKDWLSYQQMVTGTGGNSEINPKWYGYYSGKDTMLVPQVVRISIEDESGVSSLKVAIPGFIKAQLTSYFIGEE